MYIVELKKTEFMFLPVVHEDVSCNFTNNSGLSWTFPISLAEVVFHYHFAKILFSNCLSMWLYFLKLEAPGRQHYIFFLLLPHP